MTTFHPDDLGALNGLAEALKTLVEQSDLTQEEIARRTGVSRGTVSRIVNGRDKPSLETFPRLLHYGLGVTLLDFVEVLMEAQQVVQPETISRSELEERLAHLRTPGVVQADEEDRAHDAITVAFPL